MIQINQAFLNNCVVHRVGNKILGDNLKLSNTDLQMSDDLRFQLTNYFLKPFNNKAEAFRAVHDIDIAMNELYTLCTQIFQGSSFIECSQNIAKHLYTQTRHPAIKSGDLFVAIIDDIVVDNVFCKAVGVFKSERKDSFFKVNDLATKVDVILDYGISVNKLDKGCIVLDLDGYDGYRVFTHENNGADTDYWRNDFLSVKPVADNYYQTRKLLDVCKDFVNEKLPTEFEVSKADQASLLTKSVEYFKINDDYQQNQFVNKVFQEPGIMKSFKKYRDEFSDLSDEFNISKIAVKNQAKEFKSVIKLDRDVQLYINGDGNEIVRGYDESKGMQYYKIYFHEER